MEKLFIVLLSISIICFVLGLIFIVISVLMKRNQEKTKENCNAITTGVFHDISVIKRRDNRTHRKKTWYASVYKYFVNGLEYKATSVYTDKYKINKENVVIHYNLNKPEENYIESEQKITKTVAIIFSAVGIGLTILGLFLLGINIWLNIK